MSVRVDMAKRGGDHCRLHISAKRFFLVRTRRLRESVRYGRKKEAAEQSSLTIHRSHQTENQKIRDSPAFLSALVFRDA